MKKNKILFYFLKFIFKDFSRITLMSGTVQISMRVEKVSN